MLKTTENLNQINDTENFFADVQDIDDESLDDFSQSACNFDIQHMRCAAHTLQLAIRDGLKNKSAHNIVSKLRHVATMARTLKIDAILKRRAGKANTLGKHIYDD